MDLVERIQYIIKLNQLSPSAFADEIGVQRSSISHVLSGRNKPSLEFVQKIIKRYPKVDASWLINGNTNLVPEAEQIAPPKEEVKPVRNEPSDLRNSVDSPKEEPNQEAVQAKKIERVLVFYADGTFKEFNP